MAFRKMTILGAVAAVLVAGPGMASAVRPTAYKASRWLLNVSSTDSVACSTAADCNYSTTGTITSCGYEWSCSSESVCEQVAMDTVPDWCCTTSTDCSTGSEDANTRTSCSSKGFCSQQMRFPDQMVRPCTTVEDCPEGDAYGSTWSCDDSLCVETAAEGGCATYEDCERPDAAHYPNCWAVCKEGQCEDCCTGV